MAAKVTKLDEQFKLNATREKQKEGTGSIIFSGVSIYVNGYTGTSKFSDYVVCISWPFVIPRITTYPNKHLFVPANKLLPVHVT